MRDKLDLAFEDLGEQQVKIICKAGAIAFSGLFNDALRNGQPSPMLEAITTVKRAITADPTSLVAHGALGWAYWGCHLWRWGTEPEKALDAAWSAIDYPMCLGP